MHSAFNRNMIPSRSTIFLDRRRDILVLARNRRGAISTTVTSLPKRRYLAEFEPDIAAADDHEVARQKIDHIIDELVR